MQNKITSFGAGLLILRLGLVAVYLYFGISQLMDGSRWVGIVPEWATFSFLEASSIVFLNGVFEVVFAVLLALGFWTRVVSIILAVHLAVITLSIGFTPVGVRDFGLTMATIAHALLDKKNTRPTQGQPSV